jgi:hypothetical protein
MGSKPLKLKAPCGKKTGTHYFRDFWEPEGCSQSEIKKETPRGNGALRKRKK